MELPGMNAETLADFRARIEAKLECEFRKRDVIIWFGIMKGESLETVNDNLLARELKPLFKE